MINAKVLLSKPSLIWVEKFRFLFVCNVCCEMKSHFEEIVEGWYQNKMCGCEDVSNNLMSCHHDLFVYSVQFCVVFVGWCLFWAKLGQTHFWNKYWASLQKIPFRQVLHKMEQYKTLYIQDTFVYDDKRQHEHKI